MIALVAGVQACAHAQAGPSPKGSDDVLAVSATVKQENVPVGQTPEVVVLIENRSNLRLCLSTSSLHYSVHVDGEKVQPQETEQQRHRHGEFRPGDHSDLMDGPVVCRDTSPGIPWRRIFDLSQFYDMSQPGRYTAYVDVLDEYTKRAEGGTWLRTNRVHFEIVVPKQ